MQLAKSKSHDVTLWPLLYVLSISVLSIIYGYDLGSIFGNQQYLTDFFIITKRESLIVIGTYILGFIFGVFIASYITSGSGRKLTSLSSASVGTLAIVSANIAPNFTIMLSSHFVIGLSFGLYIIPTILYICEIVLPINRAFALMILPFCICFGAELSLFSLIDNFDNDSLFIYALLVIINIIVISIAIIKIPESPRYLALSGSTDAALSVLFKLRRDMGVAARELAEINECCRGETRSIEFFLQTTVYRRLLSILCLITFLINMSGAISIPLILIDMLSINIECDTFEGCSFVYNKTLIFFTFTVILLSSLYYMLIIENYTRKRILIINLGLALLALTLAFSSLLLPDNNTQKVILTIALLTFIFFITGTLLIFIIVFVSELMPIRARELGVSTIFLAHGISILCAIQSYKPLLYNFDYTGLILVFLIINLFALVLIYSLLPSFNKLSLERIENYIMNTKEFGLLSNINIQDSDQEKR